MSGGAIFYLNSLKNNKFKTVFTTHATMLGRTLCGTGYNVYEIQDKIDANQKSYELKIHTKQQTEKALANISDAFTTVSEITATETQNFFKKYPDRLLYNGFDNPDKNYEEKINKNLEESRAKTYMIS
jgi:glycogen phosphorylase/synthase